MPDYLPNKELDLQVWLNNFTTVAATNTTTLGITTAQIAVIQDDSTEFGDDLTLLAAAKAAYEGALQAKITARRQTESDVRALVRHIQNNPGVSDSLKAQLGINVPNPVRNKTAPVMPVEVQAIPEATGVNTLKWSKAGNKTTTQYVILAKTLTNGARVSDETGWNIVGQTTRAKFAHAGVTPGVPMAYKVMAARADQASLPSLPATVYGG